MAGGRVVPSDRSKSHISYYVAMAAILALLVLLCCYACYFFISRIKELSQNESLSMTTPSTSCAKKEPVSYPVQPVVRDSATAMAALCRQLPATSGGGFPQGDQVFPGPRSPAPRPAHASPAPSDSTATAAAVTVHLDPAPDKLPPAAPEPGAAVEATR